LEFILILKLFGVEAGDRRVRLMTNRRTYKVWLGIGAAALVNAGANGSSVTASDGSDLQGAANRGWQQLAQTAAPTAAGQAGQSGEAGERGEAGLDSRVSFLRDMGLIRGHLLVGDELVKQDRWDDALPHFHHPVEELYAGIVPSLKNLGFRQFDTALKALAQTVQAKKLDAYVGAWKVVDQRMTSVDQAMQRFTAHARTRFTMQTVMAILHQAGAEYEEAIQDGRVAKPVEYQDSRGFVWHAESLVSAMAPDLEKIDRRALDNVRAAFAELKNTWPGAVPPATPVKEHAAVLADISRVEIAASPFLK
jgi:hypothetical protein